MLRKICFSTIRNVVMIIINFKIQHLELNISKSFLKIIYYLLQLKFARYIKSLL